MDRFPRLLVIFLVLVAWTWFQAPAQGQLPSPDEFGRGRPPRPEKSQAEQPREKRKNAERPEPRESPRRRAGEPPGQRLLGEHWGERMEKLVPLVHLPEDEVIKALREWPGMKNREPSEMRRFTRMVLNFRERARAEALQTAERLNIQLSETNRDAFIQRYWQARARMERQFREEVAPIRARLMEKMESELSQF